MCETFQSKLNVAKLIYILLNINCLTFYSKPRVVKCRIHIFPLYFKNSKSKDDCVTLLYSFCAVWFYGESIIKKSLENELRFSRKINLKQWINSLLGSLLLKKVLDFLSRHLTHVLLHGFFVFLGTQSGHLSVSLFALSTLLFLDQLLFQSPVSWM